MGHDRSPRTKPTDDEEEDPLETMLKKTGCIDLHYKVQVAHIHEFNICRLGIDLTICRDAC